MKAFRTLNKLIRPALYRNVKDYIAYVGTVQQGERATTRQELWDEAVVQMLAAAITRHATEDDLDLYALGRLLNAETVALEEHLLVCQRCRNNLDLAAPFTRRLADDGSFERSESGRSAEQRAGCRGEAGGHHENGRTPGD